MTLEYIFDCQQQTDGQITPGNFDVKFCTKLNIHYHGLLVFPMATILLVYTASGIIFQKI